MSVLFFLCLGWIAFMDARTHRIPNKAVLLLTLSALSTIDEPTFNFRHHTFALLVVLALSLLLSLFCGLGMGDVKLLAVLSFFLLPPNITSYQIFLFVLCLTAFAYAIYISRGDLRQSLHIPLAPAISLATIITLIAK